MYPSEVIFHYTTFLKKKGEKFHPLYLIGQLVFCAGKINDISLNRIPHLAVYEKDCALYLYILYLHYTFSKTFYTLES